MNIAKKYSKEIIKKFSLIPVFLPGKHINPGDIIDFGTNMFGKAKRPIGSFTVLGNLSDYHGINLALTKNPFPQDINLVTSKEVSTSIALAGKISGVVDGDIIFDFANEGSFLLRGIEGINTRINNLFALRDQLLEIEDNENWSKYYIVTSVTICKKALVFGAQEKGATLVISADSEKINILQNEVVGIDANVNLKVKWRNKTAFSKDWEDNVTVFMELAQFKNKEIETVQKKVGQNVTHLIIEEVNPLDLLGSLNDE